MQRAQQLYHSFLTVCCIVLLGIILSVLVTWKSAEWIHQTEQERFNNATEQTTLLIQNAIEDTVQLLQSVASFLMSSDNVNRAEWRQFLDYYHVQKNFPGLEAMAYAPRIAFSELKTHEAQLHAEGFMSYKVFPSPTQHDIFPIIFIEPFNESNRRAFGYDITSETTRLNALEHAIQNNEATFSSKLEFVMHAHSGDAIKSNSGGFVIYLPVYYSFMPIQTIKEREVAARGVVIAALQAHAFFESILGMKYIATDFEIYEGSVSENSKIYDSNPSLIHTRLSKKASIAQYGQQWTLIFKSNEVLDMGYSRYLPIAELVGGIILSLLLGALLYSQQRTRQEAMRLAAQMTQKLSQSEAEIYSIFQAMNEGVLVQNKEGEITQSNVAAQTILQLDAHEILGKKPNHPQWEAIHEDGTPFTHEERPSVQAFKTKLAQHNVIMGIRRKDNSIVWVQANVQPIFAEDFSILSTVITISDITAYRHSKYALERYIDIIDRYVIVSSTDCDGIITEVSSAFCKISGYSKEELIGANHRIVRHPDMPSLVYKTMWEHLNKGQNWEGEMKNRHKDGSAYWVKAVIAPLYNEVGAKIGYTAIREDITDKKRIEELSITDRLTGLYNRLKLDELFSSYLHAQTRYPMGFAVALLDIDKFKAINDTYGHQVGDSVLQALALCLKNNIRQEDIAARWGGEEFLILIPTASLEKGIALCEKLRFIIENTSFETVGHVTVSFGVTHYCHGDDEKSMVSRADRALYRAKANGRNLVEYEA